MTYFRLLLFASATVALSFAGCGSEGGNDGTDGGGSGHIDEPCRAIDDCADPLECYGPNDPLVCGIAPREECSSNADCVAEGSLCHAIPDGCSADGVGSQCGPACTADSCFPGFRCGIGGACEAVPCTEGFVCQAYEQCAFPANSELPVYDQTDGCATISCGGDNDCPAPTVCVNRVCQESPGTCKEPLWVP